jgi:hypothetical protein
MRSGLLLAAVAILGCDLNHSGPFIRVRIDSDAGLLAVSSDEKTCVDRGDSDRDGVRNCRDECPNDAEDFDGLRDDDGCPEIDADLDGILDPFDTCPSIATAAVNPTSPGCPPDGVVGPSVGGSNGQGDAAVDSDSVAADMGGLCDGACL